MKIDQLQMHADERRSEKMSFDEAELAKLTERIIGAIYAVANQLGCGFAEKVYENALMIELQKRHMSARQQHEMLVRYDGLIVGKFEADIIVDELVLLELKAVREFDEAHKAQCINYLKATGLPVCLLVNFGKTRVRIKRFVNLERTVSNTDKD